MPHRSPPSLDSGHALVDRAHEGVGRGQGLLGGEPEGRPYRRGQPVGIVGDDGQMHAGLQLDGPEAVAGRVAHHGELLVGGVGGGRGSGVLVYRAGVQAGVDAHYVGPSSGQRQHLGPRLRP